MMKKGITVFVVLLAGFVLSSGFILKRIILAKLPEILAQAADNHVQISWTDLETQVGIWKADLTFKNVKVSFPQGVYDAEKIVVNFSLWSPKTCTGYLEGKQRFNRYSLQSDPVLFVLKMAKTPELSFTVLNGEISQNHPLIRLQKVNILLLSDGKTLSTDVSGEKISLLQNVPKELSFLEHFSVKCSQKTDENIFILQNSLFDFGTIQIALSGKIEPKSFYLDTQIRGWQTLLNLLEEEGKISSKQAKIARFSLNLLSVQGILSVPLIRRDGIIYVGQIPLFKE